MNLTTLRSDLMKEVDGYGWTPLHYAAYIGDCYIGRVLLDADPSVVYIRDNEGMSAFHIAASKGHINFMKQLIQRCSDCWQVKDNRGRNFLHIASLSDSRTEDVLSIFQFGPHDGVVRKILQFGNHVIKGCVNQSDKNGNTPLHLAAISGSYNVVISLAKDGRVDSYALNKENMTSYDVLIQHSERVDDRDWEKYLAAKSVLRSAMKYGKESINHVGIGEPGPKAKIQHSPKHDEIRKGQFLEKLSDTHLVVSALIATVTFAAGFALPGGYKNDSPDEGRATLLRKSAFGAFIITNTIALVLSTLAVLIHFIMKIHDNPMVEKKSRVLSLLYKAYLCTLGAVYAMILAFITGMYAVLAHSPVLAITTCVLGTTIYPVSFCILYKEIKSTYKDVVWFFVRPWFRISSRQIQTLQVNSV